MKKVQKINVGITDNQKKNIKDKVLSSTPINDKTKFQPKGRVRVYEKKVDSDGKKKLFLIEDTSNLIVYRGRHWLLQRAFNQNLTTTTGDRSGWSDKWINWFGVGIGGSTANPLVPASPILTDCELNTHGTMDTGTSRVVIPGGNEFHSFDTNYPRFIFDTDITNSELCTGCTALDAENGTGPFNCDGFLIGLTKITLLSAEANGGTIPGNSQDINEAGLFVSESDLTTYSSFTSTSMQTFARVTFSTIRKDDSRELIFSWYIYF